MAVNDAEAERERQLPHARNHEQRKEEQPRPTRGSPSRIQDDRGTQNGSQSNNNHVIEIYKEDDLYLKARNGNRDAFKSVLDRVSAAEQTSSSDILRRLSPAGNTFLHIAAKHGNEDIVTYIAENHPSLALCKNSNGETALHLAAKGGYESMAKALVETPNEADDNNILRAKNEKGNTALHEALINGRESTAEYLIQKDPEVSYCQNKHGESALYLAAKAGFVKCVTSILQSTTDQDRIKEQFKGNSPIQAAIMEKNKDVLEAMLNENPSLKDGEGRTPLHCAASLGYLEDVQYLLDKYAPTATQRDKSGSLPIHMASINGHVAVISALLKDCPFPEELLDGDGCNILHLAVKNGRYNAVKYILNNPHLTELINMKDKYGNGPLHLATMYPRVVTLLTWDKRVDLKSVDNQGMTALEVAEYNMADNHDLCRGQAWAALISAGVPRSLSRKTIGRSTSMTRFNTEFYKEIVNTLLLVSTLVATVTFAAALTVPGGYNSSGTDLGIATMLRDKGFHIFVFCDSIAMYSSIIAAVALIWAQTGDFALLVDALNLAVPLLGVALSMMCMTFTAGLFLAASKLPWLSTAVLLMGIIFFTMLSVILIPLCTPVTPSNRIYRYISYYPFYLVMLATGN